MKKKPENRLIKSKRKFTTGTAPIGNVLFQQVASDGRYAEVIVAPVAGKALGFDSTGALTLIDVGGSVDGTAINPASIGAGTPGPATFTTLNVGAGGLTYGPNGYFGGATALSVAVPTLMTSSLSMSYAQPIILSYGKLVIDGAAIESPNHDSTLHISNNGTGDGNLTLGSLTASGPISFDNGLGYSNGSGALTFVNLATTGAITIDNNQSGSDGAGNWYAGNSIYIGSSVSGASIFGSNGATLSDIGNSQWQSNGNIIASAFFGDGSNLTGNASNFSVMQSVYSNSSDTSGALDGSNGVTSSSDGISINAGLCVWGGNLPSSQPATPTNLAGIIAVLQLYGFCA